MIRLRFTEDDSTSRRYFKAERDGEAIYLGDVSVRMRSPSGVVKNGEGVIEDAGAAEFYIDFGTGGLDLDEAGEWSLEIIVNGEHNQEPVKCWVRPEFVRGPR